MFLEIIQLMAQVPKNIYENFRMLYTAWVDIRSLMTQKVETELSAFTGSRSQNIEGQFVGDVGKIELLPIRLRNLCPACFGPNSKRTPVCFDGNFQIKTLKVNNGRTETISERDHRDKRLFVHNEIKDPKVFVILWIF